MDARELLLHAAFLRRLAAGLLADDHLAEDAAQEAMGAAFRRRDVRNLRAWLAGATRNISLRMLRSASVRRRAERAAARREALPSADALAASAEAQHRVAEAVLTLGEPYRSAILLRFFHGLTPSEIARRSGEPVATVKTRLRRALAILRARLDETHGGDRDAWSVALLPVIARRPTTGAITGGIALMKTKILAAAALLALIATLTFLHVSGGTTATQRLSVDAARTDAPGDEAPSPSTSPTTVGRATGDPGPQPEPVSESERKRYLEWRRVLPVLAEGRRINREANALIDKLAGPRPEREPVPDPVTAAYLQDLIREYRSQRPGEERLDLLRRIVDTHSKYRDATHDPSFLAFLEDVIHGSDVEDERTLAVPDCDDQTVGMLLRLAGDRDAAVRAAAIRALAVSDEPRAIEATVRGLADKASTVRWTAALEIEYVVADPAHANAILDRIPAETHALAADAMVRAVLALDPDAGARRIEGAVASAPAATREVVLGALTSPVLEPVAGPARAGETSEARSDELTDAYLRRLVQEYRSLPQGPERLAVVKNLATAHACYLKRSGDLSFLPDLAAIARGSEVLEERLAVIRSFPGARERRVVDLLLELKGSKEPLARSAVANAMAWVQGPESDRARGELLEMLLDRAPTVRAAVATLVAVPLKDPGNVPLLLARLKEETDLVAAYAMIDAILRLDPERGQARIDEAAAGRPVIEGALRLREH